MMVRLLLYGYCRGVVSSRRIERATYEDVAFRYLAADEHPDHDTIADFRKEHLAHLSQLFVQVLRLCQQAGLVKLGHVALDGTKVKANASKHKAMSYGRMKKAEPELAAVVRGWLDKAQSADTREDEELGAERRGEEMPSWVSDKQRRLEKLREAKAALEAEAAQAAASKQETEGQAGAPQRGRATKDPLGVPKDKAQRNFTDPDSRIMKSGDGFVQAFNVQAAVDADSQVIVAQTLSNHASDAQELAPAVAQIKQNTGRQARELSADAGYCSEENLKELNRRHISGYVATGRIKHGQASVAGERKLRAGSRTQAMRRKLQRAGRRSRYRLRKQVVEPVFGQIKQGRGFRQFLLRGLEQVTGEWSLVCTAHNLLKLAAARV